MLDGFLRDFVKDARELAIREGIAVNEDGTILKPSTIKLVEEIEETTHERLIDQALETGDKHCNKQRAVD